MNVAIVNCFDTYEHRVDLLYNFFKRRGDTVRIYTSNFRHFEKTFRNSEKQDYIYMEAKPYYKNMSIQRLWSHHRLSKDIFKRLNCEKIDLIWVLIPPNSFTKDAAKYKKMHTSVKLVFDIIDMWPETMPVKKIEKLLPIQMWRRLRDDWINVADHIVTECNLYQKKLKIPQNKLTTIYLARDIKTFSGEPNLPEDRFSLCYLGSINNIIDISAIGKIVVELKKKKPVELHIIGDGEKRAELIEQVESVGAKVIYHGKIFDMSEKQNIFDQCHYGLNIMKESVFVGLTMKSMDYFEAGLPIINNIKGDTWKLVERSKIGYNIDEIDKLDYGNLQMRVATRKIFEQMFSIEAFEKKVEIVLSNIEKKEKSKNEDY